MQKFSMYTFDTNVLVYYLNWEVDVVKKVDNIIATSAPIYFSTISEAEILSFKELTNLDIVVINNNLNTLNIVPVDSKLAQIAGFLRRNLNIKLADSLIAATTLSTGSVLLTRNIKDFKNIPNLQIEKI